MGAFGITAICASTTVTDVHTLGYATTRSSGDIFEVWAGATNSTQRIVVTALGDIIAGPSTAAALATTATAGFVYIRSCNGPPTGVPANDGTGRVPLIYDYANDALYAYNTAWVSVTLS